MRFISTLRHGLLAAAAIGGLFAMIAPAQALPTLTYNLTCGLDGTCGTTSFGTITLTQVDVNHVTVAETLAAGIIYAGTGAGDALVFNVSKSLTLTNIAPAGTSVVDSSPKGVPYGTFGYGIDYTGTGTSGTHLVRSASRPRMAQRCR